MIPTAEHLRPHLNIDKATAMPEGIAMAMPVSSPHGFPRVSISWVGHVSSSRKKTPNMPTTKPTATQTHSESVCRKQTKDKSRGLGEGGANKKSPKTIKKLSTQAPKQGFHVSQSILCFTWKLHNKTPDTRNTSRVSMPYNPI